jgi:hypothetical protein
LTPELRSITTPHGVAVDSLDGKLEKGRGKEGKKDVPLNSEEPKTFIDR